MSILKTIKLDEIEAQRIANYLYDVDAHWVKMGKAHMTIGEHLFACLHFASEGKTPNETALAVWELQR